MFILLKINKQQTEGVRKKIINIFKNIKLKIENATNLKEVDFLDVTFNLENNIYRPYKNQMINQFILMYHQTIHHRLKNN